MSPSPANLPHDSPVHFVDPRDVRGVLVLGIRTPALFVTLTDSASCGLVAGGVRGGAFYRRCGDVFVVAAVGSEAEAGPRGFKRAVAAAEARDRLAFAREVAVRVVRYRADRGLTQAQLARAVGMQQSVIARLERGDQPPSLATLAR